MENNPPNTPEITATKTLKGATTPIVGRTANGDTVWYTGKAGDGFVFPNPRDAFLGYNVEGARRVATNLNRMASVHGIRFVAVAGDLLDQVIEKETK